MKNQLFFLIVLFLLCSCSYIKHAAIQAEYARIQNAEPGQVNVKHMIDRETFFTFGKTIDESARYADFQLAIAAYSNKFKENERVDIMHFAEAGTHYALNLPEGDYTLLAFADLNRNKIYDQSEIVGQKVQVLNETTAPEKVIGHVDIILTAPKHIDWVESISVLLRSKLKKSLFFPGGTIRGLDDPIFDEEMATLGMYDPASFTERAPTMFYALEEYLSHKIPVVFVHGIGGSARAFSSIVERLDRNRYQPWFFYYPSGGDLDQLADLFYRIFISGKVIPGGEMPMIAVAHSMGGLIVREALNKVESTSGENTVELFVTIASPFGGHPAAASGEKHGLIVLPAWRDVNPESKFIRELYRKPLPKSVNHQLIYAYHNPDTLKINENSDGVVPLSSQLHQIAQKQSQEQFGYNSSHTTILDNNEMITHLLHRMDKVKNSFPDDLLQLLSSGGYDVELSDDYSLLLKYIIRNYGKFQMAVINGTFKPFITDPENEHFIRVARGEAKASTEGEKEWMKFMREYPEFFNQITNESE